MEGYLGTIMMCGFSFAPQAWAFCQGATLPITQNTALYSLIGTSFGGDGRNTFNLPNLSGGIVPGGQGNNPRSYQCEFGQLIGSKEYTLSMDQMPAHTHTLKEITQGESIELNSTATLSASKSGGTSSSPENNFIAPIKSGISLSNSFATAQDATMNSAAIQIETTGTINVANMQIQPTGGNRPVQTAQPTLVLNFVICVSGMYPTRS